MPSLKNALGLKPYLAPLIDSRVQRITDTTPHFSNINIAMALHSFEWITAVAVPIGFEEGVMASL